MSASPGPLGAAPTGRPPPGGTTWGRWTARTPPRAVLVMCHGGWPRGRMRVRGWYPPVWQNALLARAIAPELEPLGVVVVQVRNRVRGWNDPELPALADARAVVAAVRHRWPDVSLLLLGYSMGGRTVARLAGEVGPLGVVVLNPWWPEDEASLVGTPTMVLQGARDRLTPARDSHRMARFLAAGATPVRRQVLGGCGHFMLRRRRHWQRRTGEAVRVLLAEAGVTLGPGSSAASASRRRSR